VQHGENLALESTELRYFVAAAETGHFTRAAQQCGVAQPSLSHQIAKLKKELNIQLFDRVGRRVALTQAGRRLLAEAAPLLHQLEDLARKMKEEEVIGHGRLALGAILTVAPFLLPAAVAKFTAEHHGVDLQVVEDYTGKLLEAVGAGELDAAIVALPVADDRFDVQELAAEPLYIAVAATHRLASRRRVKLPQLEGEGFILLHETHCLGAHVAAFCRQAGFSAHAVCEVGQVSTALELVALGRGLAFIPAMAAVEDPRRVYLQLQGETLTRTLAVVTHKHRYRTPNLDRFLAML